MVFFIVIDIDDVDVVLLTILVLVGVTPVLVGNMGDISTSTSIKPSSSIMLRNQSV